MTNFYICVINDMRQLSDGIEFTSLTMSLIQENR
jgi:hypothetical protein